MLHLPLGWKENSSIFMDRESDLWLHYIDQSKLWEFWGNGMIWMNYCRRGSQSPFWSHVNHFDCRLRLELLACILKQQLFILWATAWSQFCLEPWPQTTLLRSVLYALHFRWIFFLSLKDYIRTSVVDQLYWRSADLLNQQYCQKQNAV